MNNEILTNDHANASVIEHVGDMSFCQEVIFLNMCRRPTFRPIIAEIVSLSGSFDIKRLHEALIATVVAHEPLRSRYRMRENIPSLEVLAPHAMATAFRSLDLRGVCDRREMMREAAAKSLADLDPGNGRVVGSVLARIEEDEWLWMLAIHHLASDGWSQHIYGDTFSKFLRDAQSLPPRVGSSINYAAQQKAWFASPAADEQLVWWIERLKSQSIQPSPLPRREFQEPGRSGSMRLETRLSGAEHSALKEIARKARTPMLALVFAVFARVVSRSTGRPQVSLLSLAGGRTLPGAERASGAFYNSIVLGLDTTGLDDDRDLLHHATKSVFDGMRRQEVPLGLVSLALSERGLADVIGALPVTFSLTRHPLADFRIPGLTMREIDIETAAPVENGDGITVRWLPAADFSNPLTVIVCDLASELRLSFDIALSVYEQADAAALLEDYAKELRRFAGNIGSISQTSIRAKCGLIYAET